MEYNDLSLRVSRHRTRQPSWFHCYFIVAIPLTTYIAYLTGGLGEEIQRQEFPDRTVLGIRGYHWIWAIFPLYRYSLGIVYVGTKFVEFQVTTWSDTSILASLLAILMLIPVVAWVYPLIIVHRVLIGDVLNNRNALVKGLANFGILAFGMIVALGIQFGVYWSLDRIFT